MVVIYKFKIRRIVFHVVSSLGCKDTIKVEHKRGFHSNFCNFVDKTIFNHGEGWNIITDK